VSGPVVTVIGPHRAGVSSLAAALSERMTDVVVMEEAEDGEVVDAVVFAVSAAAPMTESDCLLLDGVVGSVIGPVVAAVTKVDAHRRWRDVLAADRAVLSARGPDHRDVVWVGVAAAPDLGAPNIDDLIASLRRGFADVDLLSRRRVCRLRDRRNQMIRDHRRERTTNAVAVRGGVQQARVTLTHWVRGRCARMVAELRAEAATLSRSEAARFETRVRGVVTAVAVEVDERVDRELQVLADRAAISLTVAPPAGPGVDVADPMLTSRRVENQLMVVLGAGFGLGVALASGRLLTSVAEGLELVGPVVGALVGLAVTVWVVGVRGLLHTRAALDRWLIEVGAAARSSGEARIAARLLATEVALATASAERDEASAAHTAMLIARIDAEIGVILK
jgi:hypothetical protein